MSSLSGRLDWNGDRERREGSKVETSQVVKNTTHHHMNCVLLGGKTKKDQSAQAKEKRENKGSGETPCD